MYLAQRKDGNGRIMEMAGDGNGGGDSSSGGGGRIGRGTESGIIGR